MDFHYITKEWFLQQKPYDRFSEYDYFYLRICRDLYKMIIAKTAGSEFRYEYSRGLAYRMTSYFEDVVNGIGLWKSVTDHHQLIYGKRVPFFTKAQLNAWEEEYDDINPGDVYFLVLQYHVTLQREGYGFEKTNIKLLSDDIFAYLDDIEEVKLTDFYEDFFQPADDYYYVKNLLSWVTMKSYLFGAEFDGKVQEIREDLLERGPLLDEREKMFFYAEQDRLMFTVPSSLSALFPLQVLAGCMRGDEKVKAGILSLKDRISGLFYFEQAGSKYYVFRHSYTGEIYNVLCSSTSGPLDPSAASWLQTTLVKFNDEYHITGVLFEPFPPNTPLSEINSYNEARQFEFLKHDQKYRDALRSSVQFQYEQSTEFFGSAWILFETKEAFEEQMNAFYQWQYEKSAKEGNSKRKEAPVFNASGIPDGQSIGYFVSKVENAEFIYSPEALIENVKTFTTVMDYFRSGVLTDEGLSAELLAYLHGEEFPATDKRRAEDFGALDSPAEFGALLRLYFPDDFSEFKMPRLTIMGYKG